VVRSGDVGVDAPRLAIGQAQPFEGLRRRHLMKNVTVDVDQRRAIVASLDLMHFPELVVQRFAGHRTFLISFMRAIALSLMGLMLWGCVELLKFIFFIQCIPSRNSN